MRSEAERVVVTGLGVVAPGATGLSEFRRTLWEGQSAVRADAELRERGFGCQVSAKSELSETVLSRYFSELERRRWRNSGLRYGLVAGLEAYRDAGLETARAEPHRRYGAVFGAGLVGIDVLGAGLDLIDHGQARRLGSSMIEMQMPSSPAALLAGKLGLGGQVSCNAAACATGTEAVCIALRRIRDGSADVVLAGSCESEGAHLWGPFEALRVLSRAFNDRPAAASRPLSASAAGFVPASGAGALVLESLEHARCRGARIYCELLGGFSNCGGQREGGSMTAPNPTGIIRCIREALDDARIRPERVDAIGGHLTSTQGDPIEVQCWARALEREGRRFPFINATKSLIGHALSASGSIELVAAALQLNAGFLHPSLNSEDPHPEVTRWLDPRRIVRHRIQPDVLDVFVKASFGFGDINACVVLSRWE